MMCGKRTKVFVNLSNHPSSTWAKEMVEAVYDLGFDKIQDLDGGMPPVDPFAETDDVVHRARMIYSQVCSQLMVSVSEKQNVFAGAHVAGEGALTYTLIEILHEMGIPCYVATTQRVSVENVQEDGSVKKESVFKFNKWRKLPTRLDLFGE